jgi:hypothetical protein
MIERRFFGRSVPPSELAKDAAGRVEHDDNVAVAIDDIDPSVSIDRDAMRIGDDVVTDGTERLAVLVKHEHRRVRAAAYVDAAIRGGSNCCHRSWVCTVREVEPFGVDVV